MSSEQVRVQVAREPVITYDVTRDVTIDVVVRDPTHMNEALKVEFTDVFAEPHPTIYSFDSVWELSFKTFTNTKLWCYRILTLLCAIPASFLWGIHFACLSCCTIWCCRPCIKAYEINMICVKGMVRIWLDALCKPIAETCGYCLYNIRVLLRKEEAC